MQITIPNWKPAALNEYVGKHWTVGHKLKKRDREMIKSHTIFQSFAVRKRRVDCHIELGPKQRQTDPDSRWKSLLDALVAAEQLVDDTSEWCQMGEVTYSRGKLKTIITLTDIP